MILDLIRFVILVMVFVKIVLLLKIIVPLVNQEVIELHLLPVIAKMDIMHLLDKLIVFLVNILVKSAFLKQIVQNALPIMFLLIDKDLIPVNVMIGFMMINRGLKLIINAKLVKAHVIYVVTCKLVLHVFPMIID